MVSEPETDRVVRPMPVTTMDLDMTNNCVLACDYCFRGKKNKRRLSWEVGTRAIDWLIKESRNKKKLSVALFGGEPLMEFKLIKRLVPCAKRKAAQHGKTYYWHVKAKDSNGVWGPWSETWSFIARGPAYPIDVAMKYDANTGTGTLTWSANPVGRPPVKYRVYGSDEQGFTVHDAPYEVKLGQTKELTNPFPANFVAEVAGTSLDVIGVGNKLPNANNAYYRVVAVDGNGKRSGDSDYVEAPRPFIYSTPVVNAPAGRAYSYQVKAIRSIGDLRRRDNTKPKAGTKFWKIERLTFSLTQKPDWMSIGAETGLITGTSDGTGGPVTISVTLTKEHRLVHDKNNIMWGNEYEQSKTYETVGPVTQQFVVNGTKDK